MAGDTFLDPKTDLWPNKVSLCGWLPEPRDMGRASAARNPDYGSLRPKGRPSPIRNRLVETAAGAFSPHPKDPIGEEEPKLTRALVWRRWKNISTLSTFRVLRKHNHVSHIWACDFFCVQTVLFQTLYVFFVVRLANREILHFEVTRHPIADWAVRQVVECCAWGRAPPRFLIHDRDSRHGASFERRVRHLGIRQVRTPLRSPRANAIAERW
jgi:transposase InsO family protein